MVRLSNWGHVRQARARFWLLAAGFWFLVPGFWLADGRCWLLAPDLVAGFWFLVAGWSVVIVVWGW